MGKGQVTIFVIVAIIMVVLISLVLFVIYGTTDTDEDIIFDLPLVDDTAPLARFLESCMELTLREGLLLVGSQGGYMEIPIELFRDSLALNFRSPIRTPMWYVDGRETAPPLDTIRDELSEYITQNIGSCLFSNQFEDELDISFVGEPRAFVQLNENDIRVRLEYEVLSESGRISDSYVLRTPIPFVTLYNSARQLGQELRNNDFLELLTIDLLAMADSSLVPVSGIDFTCSTPIWRVSEVQRNVQDILTANMPRIQVRGAETFGFEADESAYLLFQNVDPDDFLANRNWLNAPSDTFEFSHMYLQSGYSDFFSDNNVQISFTYLPEFGMDFVVQPAQGDILRVSRGSGLSGYLRFFCMHTYHFVYDLQFPVQVSFRVNDVFRDGGDFMLRFGVPVYIQQNLPAQQPFNSVIFPSFFNDPFCDTLRTQPMQIFAVDRFSSETIPDVTVQYQCLMFACDVGMTDYIGGEAQLRAFLPEGCNRGQIHVSKDGYVTATRLIEEHTGQLEIQMLRTREKPFRVVLDANRPGASPTTLSANQQAFVHLESLDFESFQTFQPGQLNMITLLDTTAIYNVTVYVYENNELIGGFIDSVIFRREDLLTQNMVTFFTYDTRLSGMEMFDAFEFLEDDEVYRVHHQPRWD